MDHVDITEDRINADVTSKLVSSPACGAISVFIGTTRDNFGGKKVLRLEYEAYIPMAKKKMMEICHQIRDKWDIHKIAMVHRIGVVPVEEASIIIAVSSPHRKESLEAVSFAIDTVKAVVPIWKKEIYGDESSAWKENKECAWTS
ncbi:molybdopterin synthase catalytic subunit-like [Ylistrum balloti]|uniref:molybdopterin synthase catalytic subunit-like n=1 Tax=Ylistrum balloti TaxID=509963 RepID=UPI002905CB3C|nr:molybdopterin synthase catalytic subunit-like [Ylistrum balloti]XP_060073589.1 molybdopterin synthase catalytic subunit-like [Ylistrum balloti]